MNHFNPMSGGLNVVINAMHHLKEENFEVCIYYYAYEQQESIHLGLEKNFKRLTLDELNPFTDIVVVAEEFIWIAHDFLKPRGIKYIIFNQGISACLYSHNPYSEHKTTYHEATSILVNSLHTARGVEKLFDVPANKIFMHRMGIDPSMYYPESKEYIASCLAYKNGNFVRFIEHYFKDKYPDWRFEVINLLPRHETAAIFRKSKLFLAFGGPEGFGLPPLEAALCGCKVIGFTGGGGEEYFKSPIFTAVNFMDHIDFVEKLDTVIKTINVSYLEDQEYITYLRNHYSKEQSKDSIVRFFSYIKENFFNI